jgi:hypothetical protein
MASPTHFARRASAGLLRHATALAVTNMTGGKPRGKEPCHAELIISPLACSV